MDVEWLSLLIGSGIGGTLVTAFLTRKSQKEKNEADNNIQLWDRTYRLIENLENQVVTLKQLLAAKEQREDELEEENNQLRVTIQTMETQITMLKKQLKEYKGAY